MSDEVNDPATSQSDVLDSKTVQMLKALGGDDDPSLYRDLVDTFIADSPHRIDSIELAAREGNVEQLMREAHGLKSSCGNMGAVALTALCRALERAGAEKRVDDARELASHLRADYDRAIDAMLAARDV